MKERQREYKRKREEQEHIARWLINEREREDRQTDRDRQTETEVVTWLINE